MASPDGQREQQLVRGTVVSVVAKSNDSFQIEVREEGSQYSRKIWTKDTQLIRQLHAGGIGQRFDFMCNVSYWRNQSNQQVRSLWYEEIATYGTLQEPAPAMQGAGLPGLPQQQSGLPVQPQPGFVGGGPAPGQVGPGYLPGVSLTPPLAAPQPVAQQPQPLPPPQTDPQWQSIPPVIKEDRILRQTAMKCACIMQPYLPEDQRGSVQALEALAEWFVRYFKGGPQGGGQQPQQTVQSAPQQQWGDGQPVDEGPPDWVTQQGAVPQTYTAGAEAQQGYGSEDSMRQPSAPGAYTGSFPS